MSPDAYFQRIGYAGPRTVSRAVIADIVLRHACAIAFENIDAVCGRGVSLDSAAVHRKLVLEGRGGWCFEHNLLLGNVLRELGFTVTDLAARVVWGREADAVAPRTHRLLRVEAEGRSWLADVGFGGQTLTGVLDLRNASPQLTPHEPFRVQPLQSGEYLLGSQVRGQWLPLFRFDLQPQQPVDFEAANYQLAHDPASQFTQGLRASRVTVDGRHALRGRELVFHPLHGESRRQTLPDTAAVLQALMDVFGIDVRSIPELPARLDALGG